jgi:ferritin
MEISTHAASNQAVQAIHSGFQRLADNTQKIIQPGNDLKNPAESLSTSLEATLIDNQQIATQIQGLAKVIKTEDAMLGKLFEAWA